MKSFLRSALVGFVLGAAGVNIWIALAVVVLEAIYFDTFSKE